MSKLSEQHSIFVEQTDSLKLHGTKVDAKPGSCGDINQSSLKHPQSILNRGDSVSSKSSFTLMFPNLMKSMDYSSGFTINQNFVPRPEKTLNLFNTILSTLKDLHQKYSTEASNEFVERSQICCKVDNRIILLQAMKDEYEAMIEEKETELKKIQNAIRSILTSKNGKVELDTLDCEGYWASCREMCVAELKLERCCGKLQFQIMNLDYISRINPLDQYELCIKLNDVSKFKTKIKVEKNGHQIWENTTFVLTPSVDDILDVKFSELKTLNKALVLLEKKIPSVNSLIQADPNIFTFWLTPIGSIKLQVIVQWNAVLDDPDLTTSLSTLDNKYANVIVKDGVFVKTRTNSTSSKYSQNRLSVNLGHLFRTDAMDRISPRGSMDNIAEHVDEDMEQNVSLRKKISDRKSDKARALYHEDVVVEKRLSERRTSEPVNVKKDDLDETLTHIIITDDISTLYKKECNQNIDGKDEEYNLDHSKRELKCDLVVKEDADKQNKVESDFEKKEKECGELSTLHTEDIISATLLVQENISVRNSVKESLLKDIENVDEQEKKNKEKRPSVVKPSLDKEMIVTDMNVHSEHSDDNVFLEHNDEKETIICHETNVNDLQEYNVPEDKGDSTTFDRELKLDMEVNKESEVLMEDPKVIEKKLTTQEIEVSESKEFDDEVKIKQNIVMDTKCEEVIEKDTLEESCEKNLSDVIQDQHHHISVQNNEDHVLNDNLSAIHSTDLSPHQLSTNDLTVVPEIPEETSAKDTCLKDSLIDSATLF